MDVIDRIGWMKESRHYNIGITGKGFEDARLAEFFEEEPVWIIAPVLEFEDLLKMLGFIGLRTMLPKTFESGFHEYRVSEGTLHYVFRVWNPGKPKP